MYLLLAVFEVIFKAFSIILLIYCISSWVIRDPFNKFMRGLSIIVDPVLDPVRNVVRRIPFLRDLPIDFSPLILMLLLELIMSLI